MIAYSYGNYRIEIDEDKAPYMTYRVFDFRTGAVLFKGMGINRDADDLAERLAKKVERATQPQVRFVDTETRLAEGRAQAS